MSVPASYVGVRKLYDAQPAEIQRYFEHLPKLISADMPYDIALAYMFARVERAHRMTLYCGIVKRYAANSELTSHVVRKQYITRDSFKRLFAAVFGQDYPDALAALVEHAEEMRDTGMHGGDTAEPQMRQAIHDVFEYAQQFNALVTGIAGFQPFGDLRGFKGRGENLDKDTTRFVLKGIGLDVR
jgi:hypothetical protein